MQYTPLGRTGLKVSVAGLGCGGNSRIGLGKLQVLDFNRVRRDEHDPLLSMFLDLLLDFLRFALRFEFGLGVERSQPRLFENRSRTQWHRGEANRLVGAGACSRR